MKRIVLFLLLCAPFLAQAQNTGIGTTSPLEFFSVGASSQFRVDANGNVVRIRDVQYSFPSAQATSAGLVLTNNGSGTLTWSKVTTANIAASGTADATTYLRGDGSWQTPSGGSSGTIYRTQVTGLNLNLTGGAVTGTTAVIGAAVGDVVVLSFGNNQSSLASAVYRVWVSAPNTVSYRFEDSSFSTNVSGVTVNIAVLH